MHQSRTTRQSKDKHGLLPGNASDHNMAVCLLRVGVFGKKETVGMAIK